jgi:hypothetical protein
LVDSDRKRLNRYHQNKRPCRFTERAMPIEPRRR